MLFTKRRYTITMHGGLRVPSEILVTFSPRNSYERERENQEALWLQFYAKWSSTLLLLSSNFFFSISGKYIFIYLKYNYLLNLPPN